MAVLEHEAGEKLYRGVAVQQGRERDFDEYIKRLKERTGGRTDAYPQFVGDSWVCIAENGYEFVDLPHYCAEE